MTADHHTVSISVQPRIDRHSRPQGHSGAPLSRAGAHTSDNRAAFSWATKGSATTTLACAYLFRINGSIAMSPGITTFRGRLLQWQKTPAAFGICQIPPPGNCGPCIPHQQLSDFHERLWVPATSHEFINDRDPINPSDASLHHLSYPIRSQNQSVSCTLPCCLPPLFPFFIRTRIRSFIPLTTGKQIRTIPTNATT